MCAQNSKAKQTGGQTEGRQRDRQRDRRTDIRRDRQAGKQTDNFLIRSQATVGSGNNVDDFSGDAAGPIIF